MSRQHWVFAMMAAVAIAWTGWLFYMTQTVADPVVVSAPQLHYASLVVVGNVTLDGNTAKVKVTKQYKDDLKGLRQQPLPETLTVAWSDTYPRPTEVPMLLPLIRNQGPANNGPMFEVAPIPRHDKLVPMVYYCTDSVRIQTERVLGGK